MFGSAVGLAAGPPAGVVARQSEVFEWDIQAGILALQAAIHEVRTRRWQRVLRIADPLIEYEVQQGG
ncbi:hypothetical protein CKO28_01075 [Rhodovibrio sodomensis]|uniref:Uncharacterized protein n=1 Tax=Rhodovibrio sodomensis TaxID=1088 RepID=A0ABS1DB33_9PROT|nr:hypothetical protein [Rhodovibrio sodomensis]